MKAADDCNGSKLLSQIPSKPRSIFRGVPQSAEFTAGVYAALNAMVQVEKRHTEFLDD